jgi:hypothetical protein
MPEKPIPSVEDRLAALATRLDEQSPPVSAADVLTRRVQPMAKRRHPLLAAGAAALAVAAAVAGFVLIAGDDEPPRVDTADQVAPAPAPETSGSTTSTTTPEHRHRERCRSPWTGAKLRRCSSGTTTATTARWR